MVICTCVIFQYNYAEKWALAFRHYDHKDTDTNMFVERYNTMMTYSGLNTTFFHCSFHNKLKTNPRYFNHNVNRRCDDLIEYLLSAEIDMFYERKRKEILTTTTEASRKREGDRHNNVQTIIDTRINVKV